MVVSSSLRARRRRALRRLEGELELSVDAGGTFGNNDLSLSPNHRDHRRTSPVLANLENLGVQIIVLVSWDLSEKCPGCLARDLPGVAHPAGLAGQDACQGGEERLLHDPDVFLLAELPAGRQTQDLRHRSGPQAVEDIQPFERFALVLRDVQGRLGIDLVIAANDLGDDTSLGKFGHSLRVDALGGNVIVVRGTLRLLTSDLDVLSESDLILGQQFWLGWIVGRTVPLKEAIAWLRSCFSAPASAGFAAAGSCVCPRAGLSRPTKTSATSSARTADATCLRQPIRTTRERPSRVAYPNRWPRPARSTQVIRFVIMARHLRSWWQLGKAKAFVRRTNDRAGPKPQLNHIRCSTQYRKTLPGVFFCEFWPLAKQEKRHGVLDGAKWGKAHGLALAAGGLYHWSEPMISRSCVPNAATSSCAKVNVASSWSPAGLATR